MQKLILIQEKLYKIELVKILIYACIKESLSVRPSVQSLRYYITELVVLFMGGNLYPQKKRGGKVNDSTEKKKIFMIKFGGLPLG